MTAYEILTLLISIHLWRPHLRRCRLGVVDQLDSQSALQAALKMASPHPRVNRLAAELALELEAAQIDALTGQHWRNAINLEADALSRLGEGAPLPRALASVRRDPCPTPLTWPPATLAALSAFDLAVPFPQPLWLMLGLTALAISNLVPWDLVLAGAVDFVLTLGLLPLAWRCCRPAPSAPSG